MYFAYPYDTTQCYSGYSILYTLHRTKLLSINSVVATHAQMHSKSSTPTYNTPDPEPLICHPLTSLTSPPQVPPPASPPVQLKIPVQLMTVSHYLQVGGAGTHIHITYI